MDQRLDVDCGGLRRHVSHSAHSAHAAVQPQDSSVGARNARHRFLDRQESWPARRRFRAQHVRNHYRVYADPAGSPHRSRHLWHRRADSFGSVEDRH